MIPRLLAAVTGLRTLLVSALLGAAAHANAYIVLDEPEFFSRYSSPVSVDDLTVSGASTDLSWIVRGYVPGAGGMFVENVIFANQLGAPSLYPLLLGGGNYFSLREPTPVEFEAVPVAVYSNAGFFGFVPDSPTDKHFLLPGTSIIYGIYTVSPASAVPEPSTPALLLGAMLVLAGMRLRLGRVTNKHASKH